MFRKLPLAQMTCIEDLRAVARRRVPRAFFDYADQGSYTQLTHELNQRDLRAIRLRQRVAVDVSSRELRTRVLGESIAFPIALAPVGLCGMQYGDGEILAARAAAAAQIPFCLSTMSVCSLEDVADSVKTPFWFQLHMMKDRGFMRDLMRRAADAGCHVLLPTLDLPALALRYADIKNGISIPPRLTLKNATDLLTKLRWVRSIAASRRKTFGNIDGHVRGVDGVRSLSAWLATQLEPALTWADIEWIRDSWPGKLVLKGILDVDDAKRAVAAGADGIVISNHGGRQLDGAPSSISMLATIVDAVGNDLEVLMDGGIRSGQDVFKALALGARCCLIGRAYVYGLGAYGEAGVRRAIDIITRELDVTMALTGVSSVAKIGSEVLMPTGLAWANSGTGARQDSPL
jgi:L-lactate dehydrogenase (cytochrome)